MSDVYGAPSGISLAEQDMRLNSAAQLSLAEGSVKLQEAQMTLAGQKAMTQMLQKAQGVGANIAPGTAQGAYDLSGSMYSLADMAMASGLPEKAKEYATAGSTIAHNNSDIIKNKLAAVVADGNIMGSLLSGVHDQTSWQQANAMYKLQTGHDSPYASQPYNPGVVQQLKMGISSAKDRALTEAATARTAASLSEVRERNTRLSLIKAQTGLAEERTLALSKAGALAKAPKAGEVKAVTDLIIRDFPGMMPEDARVHGREIAERVVDLMKNEGLTQSEAANRAYQEAKGRGAFAGQRPMPTRSGTFNRPMPMPQDKKQLRPNMIYDGQGQFQGKKLQWTGTGFRVLATDPTAETEEEQDDEEKNPDDEEAE